VADKRWKRHEREKCRALGGERTGPTGRDLPDCIDICVGLEVKSYKKFVWLTKDWQQAKENAAKLGQPPVLALREAGRGGRDMVQMHSALWLMLAIGTPQRLMPEDNPVEHCVDGDYVMRLPWQDFVALYRAYYNEEE
jgi:hypothetical protein